MNYLRDHPEKRDKQAGILAWLAMQKAFPCQPPAGDGKGLPEAPKAGKGGGVMTREPKIPMSPDALPQQRIHELVSLRYALYIFRYQHS